MKIYITCFTIFLKYIDDRNFIFDDEEDEIKKMEDLAETNNCFTINEVPEGRLSKLSSKSSRASSRSSIGSDSTRNSSNLFADRESDNVSSGHPDFDHSGDSKIQNGSKNVLLDALIKKFNVIIIILQGIVKFDIKYQIPKKY